MLPFRYVYRNLGRRPARTAVTILGIAATTLVVSVLGAFARGLETATGAAASGDVLYLIGASSETDLVRSVVPRGKAEAAAASAPGVREVDGVRAASVEMHLATRSGDRIGLLRGVTPAAWLVHREVVVVEGHEPREPYEILVGDLAATRLGVDPALLGVGAEIELEDRAWRVCGRFAAPGTILEAEMWVRLDDLLLASRRPDVSCVALRLTEPARTKEVELFAARRLDLEVAAVPEARLMETVRSGLRPVTALARWMALLVLVAGSLGCANTMFAAILARTRELGTLRALGCGGGALVMALVLEALLVAGIGGAVGASLALLGQGVALRFPMGALVLDPGPGLRALAWVAAMVAGVLGGAVPAVRAARLPLVDALGGKT